MKSVQKPNKFVVKETILVILNNYLFVLNDTGQSPLRIALLSPNAPATIVQALAAGDE